MPNSPCSTCPRRDALQLQPSAICSRSAYVPLGLSLSPFLPFLACCVSKKQNFRKFAIEWLQQRRRLRQRQRQRRHSVGPSTKMFMHFFWSLTVLKVFRILLRLLRQRRCVNCMRTKIDEYARRRHTVATVGQVEQFVRPKTTQQSA